MGIQDRDWYREEYKKKEEKYGRDFKSQNDYQGYYDSIWEEVEPSGRNTSKNKSSDKGDKNRNNTNGAQQNDYILVPGVCINCQSRFQVRISRKAVGDYTYTCPKCGRVITVKNQTKKEFKEAEENKNALPVLGTMAGSMLALHLYEKYSVFLPIIIMLLYNLWMVIDCFTKRPKTSVVVKVGAIFFFLICEFLLGMEAYKVLLT